MGKLNNELNYFLKDNQVFADMVNLAVYQGDKVVSPTELEDHDSVQYLSDIKGVLKERRNDVSKRCRDGKSYRIFCLENESKISYIMPIRGMEYEAAQYREQVRQMQESHPDSEYQNWNEFSSGFRKGDRLYPVITLVLYWQRKTWDGAMNLTDMLDLTEEEKIRLIPFLQEYHLNLINMYELEGADTCDSQLKYVLKLLQFDGDRERMYLEVAQNSEYEQLNPQTGKVIGTLLGDDKIWELADDKNEKGETFNMCKALEDLRMEARLEGRNEGIRILVEMCMRLGLNREIILEQLKEGFQFTDQEAEENLEKYWTA